MGHFAVVATCALNQWALDFDGNLRRIIESIRLAKEAGAKIRVGPELEVTGYGCLDHFLESDLFLTSWEVLAKILVHPDCQDILIGIGMPIAHRNVRYNCQVLIYNKKILMIRPKLFLANDGNYREMRYFTPWRRPRYTEMYYLPRMIQEIVGSQKVLFGDAVISTRDTCVGAETCEELFTPNSPHIDMSLNGVEIFMNSSGSHHELRKLDTRISLILEATRKSGGVYCYANQIGCDGDRLYYDGSALIIVNGEIKAQSSQFSMKEVEVITATIDLEAVRSYRYQPSRGLQAVQTEEYTRVEVDMSLSNNTANWDPRIKPSPTLKPRIHLPEEEIAFGPACWLWDYLRRCGGAVGYFIPLSGGIDSCATSVIVFSMCRLAVQAIEAGDKFVLSEAQKICGEKEGWVPKTPQELCGRIFHTCYMGTSNSSNETRSRAKDLAKDIGAYHTDLNMDSVVSALVLLFTTVTSFTPRFRLHGGSNAENLALQNIQARLRMVLSYMFAQLLPVVRGIPRSGGLLVLGSANVDECLRGYLTKFDASAADLNPIGSVSKTDLKRFIAYAGDSFSLPILESFLTAVPTAELEPITETYVQSDEADMGMTYEELSVFGRLRKVDKLGVWGMWTKLMHEWGDKLSPRQIYEKTRKFFYYYSINRHKMTVLPPAYHAEQYSPDDNRFDLRPFLYPSFTWWYRKIEAKVEEMEAAEDEGKKDQ